MADSKISALSSLAGSGVDSAADVLAIVDTSVTTNKKITVDELRIALIEEGDFTMALSFGGASTGITYASQTGRYQKFGNMVTISGLLNLTSKGSSTGNSLISGLPYAAGGAAKYYAGGTGDAANFTLPALHYGIGYFVGIGTTTIFMNAISNTTSTRLTDAHFSNTSSLVISFSYFTA